MRTLGIDLTTRKGSTGVCEIDWSTNATRITVGKFTDEALLQLMSDTLQGGGWVAIDAPFGFPALFSRVVSHWALHGAIDPQNEHSIRRRRTDEYVAARQSGLTSQPWPLSAVVERITPTVIRAAELISAASSGPADRVGRTTRIVEAYPIASLRLWMIDTGAYKRDIEDCRRLLTELPARAGVLPPDGMEAVHGRHYDDAVDALVCAFMARLAALGRTVLPEDVGAISPDETDVFEEGWIHLPRDVEPLEAIRVDNAY